MAEDAARTPKPETPSEEKLSIPKPTISPLAACATTRQPGEGEAKVEKMLGPLPYFKLAAAGDFVKLHPSDDYWSIEYFFVRVPVPGQRDAMLHLVARDLALDLFGLAENLVLHADILLISSCEAEPEMPTVPPHSVSAQSPRNHALSNVRSP